MKYFIYSAMAYNRSVSSSSPMFVDGVFEADSILALYEMAASQPEDWCLTHVAEITFDEYELANTHGIIG